MNNDHVEHYKGYNIALNSSGFVPAPNIDGSIAKYSITNKTGVYAVFAFATSLLGDISSPKVSMTDLTIFAERVIKEKIDEGIKNLEEYTFELHSGTFIEVPNAPWWKRTYNK